MDYYIGLDKTTLKNLKIISIDFAKLKSTANFDLNIDKDTQFLSGYRTAKDATTGELVKFAPFKLIDNNLFSDLAIGNRNGLEFERLNLRVSAIGANNLIPLTISAYKHHFAKVVQYIEDRYGIKLDVSEAEFVKLEYNLTLRLNKDFKSYNRLLNIMLLIAPKKFDHGMVGDHTFRDTRYIRNKSIEYKFYDKTYQLQKVYNVELSDQWLRLELSITNNNNDSKKIIEKYLGTSKVKDITDSQLQIMFKQLCTRDLIKPFNRYIINSTKRLYKELREHKQSHAKGYLKYAIIDFLAQEQESPICFDSKILLEQILKLEEGNSNRNRVIAQAKALSPTMWDDQLQQFDEIFGIISSL